MSALRDLFTRLVLERLGYVRPGPVATEEDVNRAAYTAKLERLGEILTRGGPEKLASDRLTERLGQRDEIEHWQRVARMHGAELEWARYEAPRIRLGSDHITVVAWRDRLATVGPVDVTMERRR